MSKRLCKMCEKTPLHHDNKSGVCRACKKAPGPRSPLEVPGKTNQVKRGGAVLELTGREPEKPLKGLNLLVHDAVKHLGGSATVEGIAAHLQKQTAFKSHEQDPLHAARWHSWHLVKQGFLRRRKLA